MARSFGGFIRRNIAAVPLPDSIRRIVARRPLDWTRGAGRPRAMPPAEVDIIIPVYGAAAELRACLESVVRETRHRVTLVVDGPQDVAVESVLADFSFHLLRNEQRLGFVGSVNRGMRETSSDVVLLNSDTIVTPRWVEKLIDAAYSSGDVGTVTPLSNHATLCSIPRPFEENLLPTGFDAASFAAVVENVSQRRYSRIPTGVGVCLYIRRALIDDIGYFDEQHFGLGYGEENDFCMRALARGWVHVADDATFIFHAGHRSFRASRARLERRGAATLRRLHPRYMPTIAAFMKIDPLADVRARIVGAITPPSDGKRRIVHLVHGWPPFQQAGTELYAYWLARQQQASDDVSVYVRASDPARAHGEAVELLDDGMRVRLVTNNFTARNPFRRNAIRDRLLERDFERFLKQQQPDLLHIHHLAGHAFSLARVAHRLGIPIVLQIQDWWFLCARVNLYDRDGNRCSGPGFEKCARCVTLTKVVPSPVTNRLLHVARRSAARNAIDAADAYIAGSEAIRDDYVRAGFIDAAKPFHVLPYGVSVIANGARRAVVRPIRFGYVGSIAPHKGVHVAVDAMRGIDSTQASLHVWGDPNAFPDYATDLARRGNEVVFEGRFREEDKPNVFSSMDVLLVPSIGLESFGLAAREAMTCGVPVIASAGGALSEMFAPGDGGEFFPVGNAEALGAILRRVVEEPEIIDRWSARIHPPKRNDVHAAEIEAVYDAVLRNRKS
ncbi:MAG TPA: glycosyltransferase [Thermoanaerobaculia bacterium]|jgi:glycosyltransferase involved in cell wall biosynthesis/GT2 family glycosyltransferase|nr:glycosyltransferase [Thermoanaerobaculia bacterium]